MFTFKTEPSTGRYRSFYPDQHYIKWQKKEVGRIDDILPYKIHLAVKIEVTLEEPAGFKWICLKKEFQSVKEAKEFLNANFDVIIRQFDLYQFENN